MKLLYQKKSIEDIVNQTGLKKSRIYEIKTKLKEIANQKIKEHKRRQVGVEEKNLTLTRSSGDLSHTFPDYRGLADDEQSLAGAALQFVKRITNVAPNNKKSSRF